MSGCGAGEARDEGEKLRHRVVGWVEVRAGSEACQVRCKVEEERDRVYGAVQQGPARWVGRGTRPVGQRGAARQGSRAFGQHGGKIVMGKVRTLF